MPIQKSWKEKQTKMGDFEKLLLLFKVAENQGLEIRIDEAPLHVFLIDGNGLDFSYIYRFDPEPYSEGLNDDLMKLTRLGLIQQSEVKITQKGRERLEKTKGKSTNSFKNAQKVIKDHFKKYGGKNKPELLRNMYSKE